MKNILKIILAILLPLGVYTSCNSDDTSLVEFDENTIAKRLSFVDINTRIANIKNKQSLAKATLIIVEWDEWGRKARNCDGWGLCNADWFPQFNKSVGQKSNTSNGAKTILEYDSNIEKYYIDILLADTVPSDIPLEALTLKIDEKFELDVQAAISRNLTFNEGDYPFNNNLGEFGGYRIYLD